MTRRAIRVLVLVAVAALATTAADSPTGAAVTPDPAPSPARPRPDILLVTLDTTRADILGCYGGDPGVSPNLDRIAARSHLFERCEASVPQTMPSHTTIFSGLHPFHHGVRKNLAVMVGPEVPLLAEELHGLGYATGAFVSSFVVDGRFGFARGFDHYDAPDTRPSAGNAMERRAGDTVRAAIEWTAAQPSPWFAWVHLFDPHAPYEPPPPFSGRFAGRPYAGEVAYMDNEVGRLVGSLVAAGRFDGALVVIAGDHGEALGEHGEETHGILLYEATTRVPLLVHLPGQVEGSRHAAPVGLVDVAPTVRELVGIDTSGDGSSLLPALQGRAELPGDRALYLESLEGYLKHGWAPLHAVVRGRLKYIESPRPELYDLVADPDERRDLVGDGPEAAADLAEILAGIRPADEADHGEAVVLGADEEAALVALGYVAGSPGRAAGTRRNPADAIALEPVHQRALAAQVAGDLDQAAKLFEQELEHDPSSPVLLWYLGTCLTESDPTRAAASFRRAIELRPDFEAPYGSLAELLLKQGKTEDATAVASLGIDETLDTSGLLHYLRAAATAVSEGAVGAAVRDLDVAIARAPRPGSAYLLRAALRLQRLGDPSGALADLELFVEWSTPDDIARLATDRRFDPLRGDPRFDRLVPGKGGPPGSG
jgi:arylsulfatase A-like enzyme/Flp pilus assembly protein TadD